MSQPIRIHPFTRLCGPTLVVRPDTSGEISRNPTGRHLRLLDFYCQFLCRIPSSKLRGPSDVERSMFSVLHRTARFEFPPGTLNTMSSQALRAIEEAHKSACEAGISHYKDPETGYKVFTSASHEKRGFCCGNACRYVFQYG